MVFKTPNVKVYVIDPRKHKSKVVQETSITRGASEVVTTNTQSNKAPFEHRKSHPWSSRETKGPQQPDSEDEEGLGDRLGMRNQTKFGRVTKPCLKIPVPDTPQAPRPPRKTREPPEFFRCQTCQKFYVGNARLKAHLHNYPSHQPSQEYQRTLRPKQKISSTSVAIQSDVGQIPSVSVAEPTPSTAEGPRRHGSESVSPPTPTDTVFTNTDSNSNPPFRENGVGLNPSPTPSPCNSLPFWNSFNFNHPARVDGSPENGVSTPRKEDPVDPSGHKTVWDVVERKINQNGINSILIELSDVAEKLGKIARDKIIPIREDEEERLPSSTPIVRVENPFMSHLLDLPFGAYVFREDGGIRRPPLPPPSTDLSLTAGEVDIDKFLACNMEMDLSLPHLTSSDIAAVCNN